MRLYSDYSPIKEPQNQDIGIYCSVCGRQIFRTEKFYTYGSDTVCTENNCLNDFYENNADEMLVNFAREMNLEAEAKSWFYENL